MGRLRCSCKGMVWICIFFLTGVLSCTKTGSDFQGSLYIKLVDAPAAYNEINLFIQEVAIHRQGFTADLGWRVVALSQTGRFDVLQLRNGNDRELVSSKVPVDKYDQIRMRFGYCSITVDGRQPVTLVDSVNGQISLISYPFEIVEGGQLQLTFDFEVDKSIAYAGNHFNLNAQFRIQQTDIAGSIAGSVVDTGGHPIPATISTHTGIDSVVTTNDPGTGSFKLSDLPAKSDSSYNVTIVPADTLTWCDTTITRLNVYARQITSVGAIVLRNR